MPTGALRWAGGLNAPEPAVWRNQSSPPPGVEGEAMDEGEPRDGMDEKPAGDVRLCSDGLSRDGGAPRESGDPPSSPSDGEPFSLLLWPPSDIFSRYACTRVHFFFRLENYGK